MSLKNLWLYKLFFIYEFNFANITIVWLWKVAKRIIVIKDFVLIMYSLPVVQETQMLQLTSIQLNQ